MPPREHPRRTMGQQGQGGDVPSAAGMAPRPSPQQAAAMGIYDKTSRDIRALNSSILIMSQKLQFLVRNEKILGRNLMVLNKKIKDIEEKGIAGGGTAAGDIQPLKSEISAMHTEVSRLSEQVAELERLLENVKETYAKDESVKEIKYIIDSINPLEFVTYRDVDTLLEEKLQARLGEKKTAAAEKKK